MRYFTIEPEVAGGLGDRSEVRHVGGRLQVDRLHYEFHGWLGDSLLESTPCFIVTEDAANALLRAAATGIRFEAVEVSRSREFDELEPGCELPAFWWLVVDGQAGRDDFGMDAELVLVVSEAALSVLRQVGLRHASIQALAGE